MRHSQKMSPSDADARDQALDPLMSFIVQAPAGSGKTELLIQRILTLLATCSRPEEVLAITFTRKAAGEMKARLLDALDAAENLPCPESEHERLTWERASRVIERDRLHNWGLVDNPSRLQVMTIDSLCARLVKRMPWLSRFGSSPKISNDPVPLYQEAIETLLKRLDSDQTTQGEALETLLDHLDNRLPLVRDLLIDMLSRRDQWLRHVLIDDLSGQRAQLERNLGDYIEERVGFFKSSLGPELLGELHQLAEFASRQLILQGQDALSQAMSKESDGSAAYWLAVSDLVTTKSGGLRKKVDKRQGFPSDKDVVAVEMKQRMHDFLEQVGSDQVTAAAFDHLKNLPDLSYSDSQWQILDALLVLLPTAVVEL
jgi:ATP-dependent exoDNAse (exonuclease V) beta subunit